MCRGEQGAGPPALVGARSIAFFLALLSYVAFKRCVVGRTWHEACGPKLVVTCGGQAVGQGGGGGARGVALLSATDVSDRDSCLRSELRFLHSEALLVVLRAAGRVSKRAGQEDLHEEEGEGHAGLCNENGNNKKSERDGRMFHARGRLSPKGNRKEELP